MKSEPPHPKPHLSSRPVLVIVVPVVLLAAAGLIVGLVSNQRHPSSETSPPIAAADPASRLFTDAQAADLVEKMVQTGVVTRVDVDPTYTYVMVGHPFDQLTYEQKHLCAMALHRYSLAHGGSSDIAFRDAYTNRKVATYVSGTFDLK